MKKDTIMLPKDFKSSFLSIEKDSELIIRKLFFESKPYSEQLKKLLVLNTKDCLDVKDSDVYAEILNKTTLNVLQEKGYIIKIGLNKRLDYLKIIDEYGGNYGKDGR